MHQSETCYGVVSGKSLMAYVDECEALQGAEHVRLKYERDMVPYKCSKCGEWHLAPLERQTLSQTCPYCVDSQGGPKQAYKTREAAIARAQILYRERGVKLYEYECECGYGWHLTKG